MKDLRIVIPAYNEESSIEKVIKRVREACPDAEVLVVDDGSKDKTAEIARDNSVKVISNPTNLGYGAALKAGFRYSAKSDSYVKYLAFMDADGTYPPENIPELYDLCQQKGYDVAVGSRFLGKNTVMPWMRKIGNKIFAILLSCYSGRRTTDTSTGLRVFNARLLPMVETLPDGLHFGTAMTTIALFEGLSYMEIPIEYCMRVGKSKLSNLKDGYRFLGVIMNTTRRHRPLLFFLTLGIPFRLVEAILSIYRAVSVWLRRKRPFDYDQAGKNT